MAIAAILVFFPVLVNTLRGLHLGAAVVDRADARVRGRRARDLPPRAPAELAAVPLPALKVGTVLAMIGAVVGEYFLSSQEALGFQIRNSAAIFQFELAWAAIAVASAFGILFYVGGRAGRAADDGMAPVGAGRDVTGDRPVKRAIERRKGQE